MKITLTELRHIIRSEIKNIKRNYRRLNESNYTPDDLFKIGGNFNYNIDGAPTILSDLIEKIASKINSYNDNVYSYNDQYGDVGGPTGYQTSAKSYVSWSDFGGELLGELVKDESNSKECKLKIEKPIIANNIDELEDNIGALLTELHNIKNDEDFEISDIIQEISDLLYEQLEKAKEL